MARENAKEAARQYRLTSEREDRTVTRLATLLGLSGIPRRIEAYDISNIGDECIRASMVVYADGKLKRSDYRSFKITSTDGRDDYGSMREALRRRLSHLGDGSPSLGEAPDLILLDGGDTHVGAIKPIIEELGLDIPLFGMVKDEYHKTRAITDGKREIAIATEMNVYAFIYNLQEEAHRFAVKHSSGEKLRSMKHSALEKVPGIGAKKAKALLSAFPLWKIKQATAEELMTVKGIGRRDAESIVGYYREETDKKG
jgi:excinuclease ABC subunit C